MTTDREQFEINSARLYPCPLCGDSDVQINTHPIYKPEANCNNCGISFQAQTVDEVVEGWNVDLPTLRQNRP